MVMTNVVLTFDYELFFGENYFSDEKVLFEPTNKILKILNSEGIKATFFVDICSVMQFNRYGLTGYCDAFRNQIIELNKFGHDVQLHIHPHWLNSKYIDGRWKIDKSHYRIHAYGFNSAKENNASKIIRESKLYLENILKEDPNYKCIAYRAGGYSIQPHNQLFECLLENEINIDSSISLGQYNLDKDMFFDFRKFKLIEHWYINSKDKLENKSIKRESQIYEVPIPCIPTNLFYIIKYKIFSMLKSSQKNQIKGNAIQCSSFDISEKPNVFSRVKYYLNHNYQLSIDLLSASMIMSYISKISKNKDFDIDIAILGHPKSFGDNHYKELKKLLQMLKTSKYVNLVTMKDIYIQNNSKVNK